MNSPTVRLRSLFDRPDGTDWDKSQRANAAELFAEIERLTAECGAQDAELERRQAKIMRLRASLLDIRDEPLMTLTIARSRATYALKDQSVEPTGAAK